MNDPRIAYIRTEPIPPSVPCQHVSMPNYRCTIELLDGSTIVRCGNTVEHALANAVECYNDTIIARIDRRTPVTDSGAAPSIILDETATGRNLV